MKIVPFTRQRFPAASGLNGRSKLPFTNAGLVWAVKAAGQNPNLVPNTVAGKNTIAKRVATIRSALDMSGTTLKPTQEYLQSGSSDKTWDSYVIGNAICALAAEAKMQIPWLVNIEKMGSRYTVFPPLDPKEKRPDFLGHTVARKWHVFESKGRSSPYRTKTELKEWKQQANAINRVNVNPIGYNIVSAAFLNQSNDWELLWRDPPVMEEGCDITFEEDVFFSAYYAEIFDFIQTGMGEAIETRSGFLVPVQNTGVWLGLHADVQPVIQDRDWRIAPPRFRP